MEHSLEELEALAVKFDTDKRSTGVKANGYMPLYLEYFKKHDIRRDAQLSILEIGTNKGSSLRTWAEYFPNAKVFGTDITREYELPGMLDNDRIVTDLVDQGDLLAMTRYAKKNGDWDIIIDDGSHRQDHIIKSFGILFPYLKRGGLYVAEDVITGENWMDGNTWNPTHDTPARDVFRILENRGVFWTPILEDEQKEYVSKNYSYCNYRESNVQYFPNHNSQLVFIGKK